MSGKWYGAEVRSPDLSKSTLTIFQFWFATFSFICKKNNNNMTMMD